MVRILERLNSVLDTRVFEIGVVAMNVKKYTQPELSKTRNSNTGPKKAAPRRRRRARKVAIES
jgi:hypothetical protein